MYNLVQIDDDANSFTLRVFDNIFSAEASLKWHENQPHHPLCKKVKYKIIKCTK